MKHFAKGYRPLSDALLDRLVVGRSSDGRRWRPDQAGERDNTGRFYNYFNAHDRVMGSTPLQSIGWQGIPAGILAQLNHNGRQVAYQRLLARSTPCGAEPGQYYLWPREMDGSMKPFWNLMKQTRGFIKTDIWATPDPNKRVRVNAEAVPNPILREEMADFDDVSSGERWSQKDDFPFFRDIYQRERWVEEEAPYGEYNQFNKAYRLETQQEMLQRIKSYVPEPTDHSTLPAKDQFLRRVVAFDLPIGFCSSHKDKKFWRDINRFADWRLSDPYFFHGEMSIPVLPKHVIDTETSTDKGFDVLQQNAELGQAISPAVQEPV